MWKRKENIIYTLQVREEEKRRKRSHNTRWDVQYGDTRYYTVKREVKKSSIFRELDAFYADNIQHKSWNDREFTERKQIGDWWGTISTFERHRDERNKSTFYSRPVIVARREKKEKKKKGVKEEIKEISSRIAIFDPDII